MRWSSLIESELLELTASVLLLMAALTALLLFTWWSHRRLSRGALASLQENQTSFDQRLSNVEQAIQAGAADEKIRHEEDVVELLGSLREIAAAIRRPKAQLGKDAREGKA